MCLPLGVDPIGGYGYDARLILDDAARCAAARHCDNPALLRPCRRPEPAAARGEKERRRTRTYDAPGDRWGIDCPGAKALYPPRSTTNTPRDSRSALVFARAASPTAKLVLPDVEGEARGCQPSFGINTQRTG
jgi:hypothetical protein